MSTSVVQAGNVVQSLRSSVPDYKMPIHLTGRRKGANPDFDRSDPRPDRNRHSAESYPSLKQLTLRRRRAAFPTGLLRLRSVAICAARRARWRNMRYPVRFRNLADVGVKSECAPDVRCRSKEAAYRPIPVVHRAYLRVLLYCREK